MLGMSPPVSQQRRLDDLENQQDSRVANPENGFTTSRFEDIDNTIQLKKCQDEDFGVMKPVLMQKEKSFPSSLKTNVELSAKKVIVHEEQSHPTFRNLSLDKTSAGSSEPPLSSSPDAPEMQVASNKLLF